MIWKLEGGDSSELPWVKDICANLNLHADGSACFQNLVKSIQE